MDKKPTLVPDAIRIRQATVADTETIVHHRRAMFEDMGYRDSASLDAMDATSRVWLQQTLADGTYRAWLAEAGPGRVVGGGGVFVMSFPSHPRDPQLRRPMILNVYTEPEYRRRGLARELMITMLEWCRNEGFGYVALHASDFGRPLYESLGFVATNEMRLKL